MTKYGPSAVGEKGVRNLLPERPCGCFAQKVPDPFFGPFSPVVPASITLAMLRMIHQGEGLFFRRESGDDLLRIHARLDDLQRDFAADRLGLLGHVDHAHAPLADLLEELVGADGIARPFGDGGWIDRRSQCVGYLVEQTTGIIVCLQKRLDAPPKLRICSAFSVE